MSGLFDDMLQPLGDKQRDALVSAWAALEYGSEPASEAALPALRDAALRHQLDQMLHMTGRTLAPQAPTSGHRDTGTISLQNSSRMAGGYCRRWKEPR
ncbi:hypothetical protein AB0926_30105 [Streptomyces griseoincarnatus]